jgi:arylsulfatase A-like enzyme
MEAAQLAQRPLMVERWPRLCFFAGWVWHVMRFHMEVSRRQFFRNAAALGLAGMAGGMAGCGENPKGGMPEGRPNIVLIVLDTLRADKMGCYGAPFGATTALDRLAERGVVFEHTVAQCSWTRPSMGSLLTSLHPRTLGLYTEHDEALNSSFPTMSKLFKAAGYRTFGATANPNLNVRYNFHEGYDTYFESSVVFDWMGQEDGQQVRGQTALPSAPWLFQQALEFAQEPGDTPGFMMINCMEVHEWYARGNYKMIRAEYDEAFLDSGETHPKYLQATAQLANDTVSFIERIGALPGWENTLFAFVSDHGEGLDSHPDVYKAMYHGRVLYESNVMVPWILYHPHWSPARNRVAQPVRLLEVLPTLLDFVGIELPAGIEGKSMMPLLTGAANEVKLPDRFVLESHYRPKRLAVYDPAWKLFDNYPPHETVPRVGLQAWGGRENGLLTDQSSQHPEIVASMQQFLRDWEEEYPPASPTPTTTTLSDQEREQLEAIGYLGDD